MTSNHVLLMEVEVLTALDFTLPSLSAPVFLASLRTLPDSSASSSLYDVLLYAYYATSASPLCEERSSLAVARCVFGVAEGSGERSLLLDSLADDSGEGWRALVGDSEEAVLWTDKHFLVQIAKLVHDGKVRGVELEV